MTSRHACALLDRFGEGRLWFANHLHHCSFGSWIGIGFVRLAPLHSALDCCYLFVRNWFGICAATKDLDHSRDLHNVDPFVESESSKAIPAEERPLGHLSSIFPLAYSSMQRQKRFDASTADLVPLFQKRDRVRMAYH